MRFAPRTLARLGAICLLALCCGLPLAQAHETRPAYLELRETAPGQYAMLWRTPVLAGAQLPVLPRLPQRVRELRAPLVQQLSDSRLERRWLDAGPQGLAGERIEFAGLPLTITDAVVRVHLLDGRSWMAIARPSRPWVEFDAGRAGAGVVFDFIQQGGWHILGGPDHLLFVFGLLLIVRRRWSLVKTVTAFTIAHSLTLAVAVLGVWQPPVPPMEAAIALSILFLGPEILRARRGETSFTILHPWIVAFAFGLLHGFGFAGALSAAGLPQADVPLALVSFNIGVELGQLGFVALVLLLARGWRAAGVRWAAATELLPAYLVGGFGAFWVIQRLVAL